jgi:hypothetical protein
MVKIVFIFIKHLFTRLLPPILLVFLTYACSPEKKADRFIRQLKDKMPSAIILEKNFTANEPYVCYTQTQPAFNVYKHLLNSRKDDEQLVQEGKLIYQTRDSIPRFIYLSISSQLKAFHARKGDSLLVASPVINVTQVFNGQDDSTAWFSYERLGQLYRLKIASLASNACLPENAKLFSSDTQRAFYMLGDDLHDYIIGSGADIIKFTGIKKIYPVKTSEDTRLVDMEDKICYWNMTTNHIDTLLFNRGIGNYGDAFLAAFDHPFRKVFYTKSESKYLIGLEINATANEKEMCFFLFDPQSSSYYPDYLGSETSENGMYSYENEGRAGVISLSDDYSYTDYDFDGNLLQERPTARGYIAEREIHSSMILAISDHSVCYINGSTVVSFNDLEGDTIEIKSGTISTVNAGEIKVSISMENVYPTSDRKRLVIDASNPGFLESGAYLLSFDPDNRVFRQIDFGTSVYRERNRFRVKHIDDSVSYYDQNGNPVSSGILDDISDWLFGF